MVETYGFISVGVDGDCNESFLQDRISTLIEHIRFSNKKIGESHYSNWHVFSFRSESTDQVTSNILHYLKLNGSLFAESEFFSQKKVSISIYEKSTFCGIVISSELASQIGAHGFDLEIAHYNADT